VIHSTQRLDTFIDHRAPAITDHAAIRGGITIFKLQAACPFKAFAELRLHAKKLETPTIGLRALDRGIIAHKALEFIWLELKNSQTLNSLSTEELASIIYHSAEQAIETTTGEKAASQRYLTLELHRLEKLLTQWLEIEKHRPAFTVLFQEYEKQTQLGLIPLTLRVDRIDQLDDGTQLIIDYKTGKHNEIKGWFGERLDEPQLPLYCVTDADHTVGIAFAKINPNKIELIGVSKLHLGIDSIKMLTEVTTAEIKIWSQQLEHWHNTLEKLGNDFCHGVADVDPKHVDQTCRHCNLQGLCRINEIHA
jgi:ATP-dependent helicase/nuclease subunit B